MSARPTRIQLRRKKGWRMPPNTVKVDRTTGWGNPFNFKAPAHCWTALAYGCKGDPAGRHEASIKAFREWIESGKFMLLTGCGLYATDGKKTVGAALSPDVAAPKAPSLDQIKAALSGKNLACWCPLDKACHADVLLELANGGFTDSLAEPSVLSTRTVPDCQANAQPGSEEQQDAPLFAP